MRNAIETRMLQALVAFATLMAGAAVALAQTVTPDDPGIAPPGPEAATFEWWWAILLIVLAAVVIWFATRGRRRR